MRKTINVKFHIGDKVTLESEPDVIRVVSGYLVRERSVSYLLDLKGDEAAFEGAVISKKKNIIVKGFKK